MKPVHALGILALFMSLSPGALAQSEPKKAPTLPAPPEGVFIEQDVGYLQADRAEKADLYLPPKRGKKGRSPGAVIIHRGRWTGGDKAAPRQFHIVPPLALTPH